jgi:group I intron endonuclease
MIISGIYRIQSKVHEDRIYIGSAVHVYERWYKHRQKLRKNKHENSKLQNHFNKYGFSDLTFNILLFCKVDELAKAEQYFIDSYNPWFNICKIVGTQLGRHWKANISRGKIGNKNNLGKKRSVKRVISEEVKDKISIGTKKAMEDPMLRLHLSNLKKGQPSSFTGKHHTEESNQKNRDSHLGKTQSPETKLKKSKTVLQFDLNGVFIKEWKSLTDAATTIGMLKTSISYCANGKLKTSGGFIWRFKNKTTEEDNI